MLAEKIIYKWWEIGSLKLTPIVDEKLYHAFVYPEVDVHPLTNNRQDEYLSKDTEPRDVIREEALTFMPFHRIFDGDIPELGSGLKNHDLDELYNGDILLSMVFRSVLSQ